jgi:hypothetical protein
MFKELRIKLADKLLQWAMAVDFETVMIFVIQAMQDLQTHYPEPKRKVGRPLGSKDKGPRKVRNGVKIGRPKGVKDGQGRKVSA